jgi:hypothetical protein
VIATSPPGDLPPDTDLLVHPVYLAGRGDTATLHEALCDARGWGKATTATGMVFTSPRQDAQVAYLPESRYGGWKAVQYREPLGTPLWWATFSRNTPAEITSAFTTALAEDLPSRLPAQRPPPQQPRQGVGPTWVADRRHRHVPIPAFPRRARLFRSA